MPANDKLFEYKPNKYNPTDEKSELIELIDLFLKEVSIYDEFSLTDILYKVVEKNLEKSNYFSEKLKIELEINLRYIERSRGSIFKLTGKGKSVKENGGYKKYIELLNQEAKTKKEKEQLELYQLRWFVKTKWIPFVFSALAVLISIGALIVSLFKP